MHFKLNAVYPRSAVLKLLAVHFAGLEDQSAFYAGEPIVDIWLDTQEVESTLMDFFLSESSSVDSNSNAYWTLEKMFS